ncbi:hypothetical protein BMETH_922_0 [methanotrophic bacterial endosymbiont of Bathymodiolus sp.]|nr:hypothetical protein BMETH_922_0 [methanotrophic bacterial endosymbiont of Bathymodiolus sp.]
MVTPLWICPPVKIFMKPASGSCVIRLCLSAPCPFIRRWKKSMVKPKT